MEQNSKNDAKEVEDPWERNERCNLLTLLVRSLINPSLRRPSTLISVLGSLPHGTGNAWKYRFGLGLSSLADYPWGVNSPHIWYFKWGWCSFPPYKTRQESLVFSASKPLVTPSILGVWVSMDSSYVPPLMSSSQWSPFLYLVIVMFHRRKQPMVWLKYGDDSTAVRR